MRHVFGVLLILLGVAAAHADKLPNIVFIMADDLGYGYLDPALGLMPHYLKQKGYATALIGKWHLGLSSPNLPNERGFDLFRGHLSGMMDYYSHEHNGVSYLRHDETPITTEGHATDLFSDWAVEHMDDGIGRVLDALAQTGQTKDTLVVFVSDNGGLERFGSDNGPLRGGKQDLFEGGIRVPGMAMWPGRVEPGTTRDDVLLTMDWLPTFASLVGLEVAHEMDGRDMSAELERISGYLISARGGLSRAYT